MSVCVVGCGIIGLSTACEIQKSNENAKVTIVADRFSEDTVSAAVAGLWRPFFLNQTPAHLIHKWGLATFQKMYRMAWQNPDETGCLIASGYEFTKQYISDDELFWRDIVQNFRRVPSREVEELGVKGYSNGIFLTTNFLEPILHMPYLQKGFEARGGRMVKRKLNSLEEIAASYDVIVNCSGLGARWLVDDAEVYPVRGQVIRVEAPYQKHFMTFGDRIVDQHILVNRNTALLGTTHQENDWDTNFRQTDYDDVMNNLAVNAPWVKRAKVLRRVVGLRPCRSSVRLELDQVGVNAGRRTTPVVHNYGHGGSGVTLHHGCALDAAQLVKSVLHNSKAAAKL